MFKEISDQLIKDLKLEFNINRIEKIDKYRGEFSEDSSWTATDTVCFLRAVQLTPIVRSSKNQILKFGLTFRLYIGANSKHDKDALDVAEDVINFLSDATLTVTINSIDHHFIVSMPGVMEFFEYTAGYEVYSFDILIK